MANGNMSNPETDTLNLVEISTVKGLLGGWLGRTITAAEGFSLEVFRGDTHLGTILSSDVRTEQAIKGRVSSLRARNEDAILRINLGPRLVEVAGVVTTRDNFQRAYKASVELRITNPPIFARLHRQGSDPIKIAVKAMRTTLQSYADRTDHDLMDRTQAPFYFKLALGGRSTTGLSVSAVYELTLDMDPRRLQIDNAIKDTEVQTVLKDQAGILRDIDRQDDIRQRQHDIHLDQLTAAAERQNRLYEATSEGISAALSRRIQQLIELGVPLSKALAEYPELEDIFLPPGQTPASKAIAGPGGPRTFIAEPDDGNTSTTGELTAGTQTSVKQLSDNLQGGQIQKGVFTEEEEGSATHPVTNTDLGLELTMKVLKPKDCEKAKLPEGSRAFQVTDVEEDGPAAKAGVQGLDFLLQINGKPLQDALSIGSLMQENALDTPIKLLLLRKGLPEPVTLNILFE